MHTHAIEGVAAPDYVVPRLVADVVERFPDNTAIIDGDRRFSYRELQLHTLRVAQVLRARGIGHGDRIAVLSDRRAELYPVLLAILTVGAAAVPLDPAYPAPALADIVTSSGAVAVVQHGDHPALDALPLPRWDVDDLWAGSPGEHPGDTAPSELAARDLEPDDLALILYTSGSTGEPKGVEVPHRGLARLAVDGADLGVTEDDCFVQLSPVSFAASTNEIWLSLLHGARLVVLPSRWPSLTEVRRLVADHGVTFLSLPGGLFSLLVEGEPETLDRLRIVLVSGDFVPAGHLEAAAARGTVAVFHGFGCTENSSISIVWPVPAGGLGTTDRAVPVGRPLRSVRAQVMTPDMEPCSPGEVGDLHLGGLGVARGYRDLPEQTADRFADLPDLGWTVRTGDLARLTDEGDLVLVGRTDSVVKIRGFRVETAAVEAAVRALDAVDGAAVIATGADGARELTAFYTARPGTAPNAVEMTTELGRTLPGHMIPTRFVARDELPTTRNGKLDRRALAASDERHEEERKSTMENPLEGVVLQVWRDTVKVDDASPTDPFLAQGATSLNFVQFSSSLEKVLGVEVGPEDVFRHGDVEKLTRFIQERRAATPS